MAEFSEVGGGASLVAELGNCVRAYLRTPVEMRGGTMILSYKPVPMPNGRGPILRFEDDDLAWLAEQLPG